MTNCLVNNVTNMTLVLGVPAIFWSMNVLPAKKNGGRKPSRKGAVTHEVNRLSLLLTLTAVLFFTGTTWVLGQDGQISFTDGLVLVGIFVFWQCFHVFEVLKSNVRQNKRFALELWFDLALVGVGAWGVYVSTTWLVDWVSKIHTGGFINADHLGWLSGWLDVLPNAMLAVYYAWTRRPEIVYTSQVGDGHICIPLCIGIFALFKTDRHAAVLPHRRHHPARGVVLAFLLYRPPGPVAALHGLGAHRGVRLFSLARAAEITHSAYASGLFRTLSLNSTNGTCASIHRASRVIPSIEFIVLFEIRYSPSPSTMNASNNVPTPCRVNSKSPAPRPAFSRSVRSAPEVIREILQEIVVARPEIIQDAAFLLRERHDRPFVKHGLRVTGVHLVGALLDQSGYFFERHVFCSLFAATARFSS